MDINTLGPPDVERLRGALHEFDRALSRWLTTQVVHSDPTRSGRRPTVVVRDASRPEEVQEAVREVRQFTDLAAEAVALTGAYMTPVTEPGVNAVRDWETMGRGGVVIEPDDVVTALHTADELLGLLLSRLDSGSAAFPVKDPRELHPLVWNSRVSAHWLLSNYDRVPEEAAAEVHYFWARHLSYPKYPEREGFWEALLADAPAAPGQPRLRVQVDGSDGLTDPQRRLREELVQAHREAIDLRTGQLSVAPEGVATLVERWSSLAYRLHACRIDA